jgi:L-glutamine-phosphate cytidylyltransferase
MLKMKAIILAAGQGTRLRPYTLDKPKCLVEVDGVSLLDRQLSVLRSRGIDEILLLGGYLAEMLQGKATQVLINRRYAETNMVFSLFCAEDYLEGEVIVAYGDIVYSGVILDRLIACTADIAVTIDLAWESYWRARNEDPLSDAETLRLAPDGQILEIGKKPTSIVEVEGQYMGLMKFSDKGLSTLRGEYHEALKSGLLGKRPVEKAHMTDMLQALIERGQSVQSVSIRGSWIEVDTVKDLRSTTTKNRLSEMLT